MALGELQPDHNRKPTATNETKSTSSKTEFAEEKMASEKHNSTRRVAYMAGKDDFRAARMRCALACEDYNKLSESAMPEERLIHWMKIVDPKHKNKDAAGIVTFSDLHKLREPHDDKNSPKTDIQEISLPSAPYVKTPLHVDYGLRLRIAPTTFINRNCFILDTPVADIIIRDNCSIGPNVTIIGVGHPVIYEERCEFKTGKAGSWGAKVEIQEGVWIGAGVTILPGVTIGEYSTIAAGSIVTKDIPSRCMAAGNPASVRYLLDDRKAPMDFAETAMTLEDALKVSNTLS